MAKDLSRLRISHCLYLLAALFAVVSSPAFALDSAEQELLDVDQAFRFSADLTDKTRVQATWDIAEGYYLYRDRIRFHTDTPGIELGQPLLPPGEIKDDEFFGKLAIYRKQAVVTVPFTRSAAAPATLSLTAVSQGCADIGVCFPPHVQVAKLDLPPPTAASAQSLAAWPATGDKLALGDTGEEKFLDADQAFQISVSAKQPDLLRLHWDIAEGYYLYRDKFKVRLVKGKDVVLGPPSLPPGKTKHDEFLGDVQVFHNEADMRVPIKRRAAGATDITLQATYQGCAEAGICYPPIKKTLPVTLAALNSPPPATAATAGDQGAVPPAAQSASPHPTSRQHDVERVLRESGTGWIVLFFFGAGLLLAFTACMYPMIPILSSIIVGHGASITTRKAFSLSLTYVEAMAVTYALIGVISAQVGAGVQAFFQNPWILTLFALMFVVLALSMFGFFDLQLPASWQSKLSHASHRQKGGTLLGVAAMGVLSALIVGPCAGPVLIGALLYSSHSGDYLNGALAMFALGNGMGAPLLVICTSGGKLLPKAGRWMVTIKAIFGVVLLGVAILMLERILPGPVTLTLWALLLIIPAVYMGALDALPAGVSGWRRFWKGLGIAMLVYGVILVLGAASGAHDPLNPLRNLVAGMSVTDGGRQASLQLPFKRIKSIDDFDAALRESTRQGKPVMLDFYADWCTYCVKMEDYTFSDARVQQALAGVTLLQADVTANDAADVALLNHFKLFAPPATLFFGPDGQERTDYRLVGYLGPDAFLAHLKGAIGT
jgi:thiol:disulfide interchange protein DsbD